MSASGAVRIYREKLEFLLAEEAKAVDSAQRFKLRQDIAEVRAKIEELGGPVGVAASDGKATAKACKILFLAANPKRTERLALDEDARQIEEKVESSDLRDSIEIITKWAVRPDDLLKHLNKHRPDVVHFSGHGSEEGEIMLVDDRGKAKPVSKTTLVYLFSALKDNIKVVMLNACYSEAQARAITEVIDFAVGMSTSVSDKAAIVFASSFYRAIGYGRSVQAAFDQGKAALMLEGIDEATTPRLSSRAGVDPARSFLCVGGE